MVFNLVSKKMDEEFKLILDKVAEFIRMGDEILGLVLNLKINLA